MRRIVEEIKGAFFHTIQVLIKRNRKYLRLIEYRNSPHDDKIIDTIRIDISERKLTNQLEWMGVV